MALEFKDGLLNGYVYYSSFDEDRTKVPRSNIDGIIIGKSTKDDILTLFGKPHGKILCPTTFSNLKVKCDKATEIWLWNQLERGYKMMAVSFNKDGEVIDLEMTGPQ